MGLEKLGVANLDVLLQEDAVTRFKYQAAIASKQKYLFTTV